MPITTVRSPRRRDVRDSVHVYGFLMQKRKAFVTRALMIQTSGHESTKARRSKIPDFYAGDGFSCGEMLGAGRTTPFDGTGGFSFLGSTRGDRRSSRGWPAISILISAASNDSRSSNASAIRIRASR